MSFKKIITHPNRNIIIRMLNQGQGVRAVAKAIRELYPDPKDKKMHVSVPTLQKFRKEKLNLEGDALEAIKQASKEKKEIKEAKKEDSQLKRLPAYKEKLKEIVDYHVDIQNELKELMILAKARMEDLFNKAARGEITINEEANLQRYFQIITTTIERWAKYVEKIADKTVETNVNITVIEDQMSVMREAIREVISEMDPEMSVKFLDKLSNKMAVLSYRQNKGPGFHEIRNDVQMLTADVEEIETDGN